MQRDLIRCSVHNRLRAPDNLIDLGGGVWRCAPGNECRELDLEVCSVHGRRRQRHDLVEISPGVWQCSAARPCFEAGGGGGRGGGGGQQQQFGGRGGGMGGGGAGAGPGAGAAGRGGGGTGGGMMMGAPAPTSFSSAGYVRTRDGFAASAVVMGDNQQQGGGQQQHQQPAAQTGATSGGGMDFTGGGQQSQDQILARFVANQQLQEAAAAAAAGESAAYGQQLAQFYLSTARVWCCKHGRTLPMQATRSLDGGMTYVCLNSSECLSAPLDDPKVLAMQGCTDLWCSKHRRMRAPGWLTVDATTGRGFVCKKPHVCRPVEGGVGGMVEQMQDDLE